MAEPNLVAWRDPVVVDGMGARLDVTAQEEAVLAPLAGRCAGGRVLELGVGGGRLAPRLLALSRDYLGVDYSPEMVALSRRRLPGVAVELDDARELRGLRDGSYDLVVFGFNGLDYGSHEDRGRVLRRVAALLKPGGAFVFSAHNKDMDGFDGQGFPWPPLRRHPLRGLVRMAASVARRLRNRAGEVRTGGYAIVNEPEFDYRLMTYYVTVPEQLRQLRAAGFAGELAVVDMSGREVAGDRRSRILYYRAFR